MSALPNEPINTIHLVTPPKEMIESENLVVRQANALVIASDEDYNGAQDFLNSVIAAGKREVEELFNPHVKRAFDFHRALTADRAKHLKPWEEAERLVKLAMGTYYRAAEQKRVAEQRDLERKARELEEERQRQEAAAERERAQAEADRRRKEAEARRIEQEAEAERLRNVAAEQNDKQRQEAEARAKEIEEQSAREAQEAEAEAARIAASGEAAAQAIEQEPVHVEIASAPAAKLKGVAQPWTVDKEDWNPVAFAKWIAKDPEARAKYIGEPAWTLLIAEAKQQKSLFSVDGIKAGPKTSVRMGGR